MERSAEQTHARANQTPLRIIKTNAPEEQVILGQVNQLGRTGVAHQVGVCRSDKLGTPSESSTGRWRTTLVWEIASRRRGGGARANHSQALGRPPPRDDWNNSAVVILVVLGKKRAGVLVQWLSNVMGRVDCVIRRMRSYLHKSLRLSEHKN
jgi:hypothetical protein